jgi:hypothetical protein
LVRPASIFLGKYPEIVLLLQFKPAPLCCIDHEKLVRSAPILLGKYAEIDILV